MVVMSTFLHQAFLPLSYVRAARTYRWWPLRGLWAVGRPMTGKLMATVRWEVGGELGTPYLELSGVTHVQVSMIFLVSICLLTHP